MSEHADKPTRIALVVIVLRLVPRGVFSALIALLCAGTLTGVAVGGHPDNDDCENRSPIGNGSTNFSNQGATDDGPPGGPCARSMIGSDIWYNYNATFTGDLSIDTCGSTFDTVLAVYDSCGCPANQELVDGSEPYIDFLDPDLDVAGGEITNRSSLQGSSVRPDVSASRQATSVYAEFAVPLSQTTVRRRI